MTINDKQYSKIASSMSQTTFPLPCEIILYGHACSLDGMKQAFSPKRPMVLLKTL